MSIVFVCYYSVFKLFDTRGFFEDFAVNAIVNTGATKGYGTPTTYDGIISCVNGNGFGNLEFSQTFDGIVYQFVLTISQPCP